MKKLFAGLVTAKPPREVKGKVTDAICQDLSSYKPSIKVPQEDTDLGERARSLLLYDAALTPSEMPGAYGLEPWALDTARIIRASKLAKDKLPGTPECDPTAMFNECREYTKGMGNAEYDAFCARMEALTDNRVIRDSFVSGRLREKIDSTDWRSWEETVGFARALVEEQERYGEKPKGRGPKGPGEDEGDGDSSSGGSQPDDSWLGDDDSDEPDEDEKPQEGSAAEQEAKELQESLMPNPETGAKPKISRFDPDPWSKGKLPKPANDRGVPGRLENEDSIDVLPMEPRRSKLGVRRRPEMEGCVPSAFHRLLMDRKIFRGAKKRGGMKGRGTILVDMSGSMSWGREDFEEMLKILPECTVYGYSGYAGGTRGRIVKLADRGRSAKIDAIEQWRYGKGSNIVDDSCLRFLAKCSKPRIWISDGGVTGNHDRQTPYIVALCNEAIVRGGIVRVLKAKDAVKKMLG